MDQAIPQVPDSHRDLLEAHETHVDVDRLGIAVGEDAREQHQHEQDGDEYEPAQRYQGTVLTRASLSS